MKKDIHPEYNIATVKCVCGNEFQTRSTLKEISVEICAACHPFFTGQQKLVDSAGRVERFMKKYGTEVKGSSRKGARPKPKPDVDTAKAGKKPADEAKPAAEAKTTKKPATTAEAQPSADEKPEGKAADEKPAE
jgi:large subunit ribosomal protein L31